MLDSTTLLLPFLCLQHRTGNVVERVTKLLGVLTGSYAVSKTLRSGPVVRRVTQKVREVLSEKLQVMEDTPAALAEEWASGQVCAKRIFELVQQESADDEEEAAGRSPGLYDEFTSFFAGPWTGPWVRGPCQIVLAPWFVVCRV